MAQVKNRSVLRWNGLALHINQQTEPMLTVVPDEHWPGMYRVRYRDGRLSDMVNLTRARDAAETIAMAEANRDIPLSPADAA